MGKLRRIYKDEENAADNHNDQHKAGSAALMLLGAVPDILHIQLQAVLYAIDALMLRAMIGKDALHVLHPGNQDHIGHKNDHTDQAFHQVQPDG